MLNSFHITVHYIGQEVLRREVRCNDVRIAYLPPSPVPPSPPSLNGTGFHRIPLPAPPSDMVANPSLATRLKDLRELLPFLEWGVVLTATGGGIYAKRFCQGRVFWRGPHNTTTGPCKMERGSEPTQLFNMDIFRQGKCFTSIYYEDQFDNIINIALLVETYWNHIIVAIRLNDKSLIKDCRCAKLGGQMYTLKNKGCRR